MNETVKLILSLSLSGSILAVLVFAMKPFLKHKLSKSIQYYIWIIVLLRLIIPFSFEDSIMNDIFYNNRALTGASTLDTVQATVGTNENIANPSIHADVREGTANSASKNAVDYSRYFKDAFNRYALYLWLSGMILALIGNFTGYAKFLKYLKQGNIPATDEQNRVLTVLLNGKCSATLVRNSHVATPMLIGILKPCIIIPDINFDEEQLRNILLHEFSHLKRFDIEIKWLTMLAVSIHWFNPFMYFIKNEINHACELACDEAVIKNLCPAEKQAYGDTLIYVVAEHKYPFGVLQATMCEEKRSLKERLIAIMNHSKKSKLIILFSAILLGIVIFGALYLGAGVGISKNNPPSLYISAEAEKTKTALMGTYNLSEISKHKTPYIGNNSKVLAIVGNLPVPDNYFKQQYISMITKNEPYKLNVYYEVKDTFSSLGEWPNDSTDSALYANLQTNALVLFCMIDNADEVTFLFRNSQSEGKLDETKYEKSYRFLRTSFEDRYGKLSVLRDNLDLLQEALEGKASDAKGSTQEISVEEKQRIDLYTTVMEAAYQMENGGNKFVAVKLDTLEGISDQAKEEVLRALNGLAPNVYNFETIKNDNTKFEFDANGRLIRAIDGALLWVEVSEYSEDKAVITGVSWFGNMGAVLPKYEATYINGVWKLKQIGMAIS